MTTTQLRAWVKASGTFYQGQLLHGRWAVAITADAYQQHVMLVCAAHMVACRAAITTAEHCVQCQTPTAASVMTTRWPSCVCVHDCLTAVQQTSWAYRCAAKVMMQLN